MSLYRLARLWNTAATVASGDPDRIARRAQNIATGRILGRLGVWRRIWR